MMAVARVASHTDATKIAFPCHGFQARASKRGIQACVGVVDLQSELESMQFHLCNLSTQRCVQPLQPLVTLFLLLNSAPMVGKK
jgi:hypothetical protein